MARVLLVDDDLEGLELRGMLLARDGHHVSIATDAATARIRFTELRPECVVLDVRLPEAEAGRALIREFRAAAPCVRILVLAGEPADLDGREERAMTDEVLRKPVRSERLRSEVRRVVG